MADVANEVANMDVPEVSPVKNPRLRSNQKVQPQVPLPTVANMTSPKQPGMAQKDKDMLAMFAA